MSQKNSERLVEALQELVAREDRATLARLRDSWRPGRESGALAFVLPFIERGAGEHAAARDESDALLVAALFAMHRSSGDLKLPRALALLAKKVGSDSIELRFRALLESDREELPVHLRSAVMLVKDYPLDWGDLLRTIRFWDQRDESPHRRSARRRWAVQYWGLNRSDESAQDEEKEEVAP